MDAELFSYVDGSIFGGFFAPLSNSLVQEGDQYLGSVRRLSELLAFGGMKNYPDN
jgi:hypothetical protein